MGTIKFFLKAIALLLIWFIGASLIYRYLDVPYAWVTDRMLVCHDLLHHPDSDYNAVFVGCSKTQHGLIPEEFDKMVAENTDIKMNSMNFGLGGANAGQIYGMTKTLIDDPELNLEYIFMELRSIDNMIQRKAFVKNLHTYRDRLWMKDLGTLRFAVRSVWGVKNPGLSLFTKLEFSIYMLVKYIENQLNIGGFMRMLETHQADPNVPIELGNEGFYPIMKDPYAKIHKLRRKFTKKSKKILDANVKAAKIFGSGKQPEECKYYNKAYADELNRLIKYGDSKGVKIMIVALPMLKAYDYQNVYPVLAALPKARQLDLADSRDNVELYYFEHCWDDTHTNYEGAVAQTHRLAKSFVRTQRDKHIPVPYWQKKRDKKTTEKAEISEKEK